ncbi:hypothetical protein BpHYR1_039958 [Brachionus plicatilis]|uniref:Uncharacterized protein n=1 Tax=Brachionus plicatilis TaxID=10195 RepID=A0A3M7PP15_BRAPC|nr:hypothetical protein BpHYR1_039958 [Brachionus plicatilis]
MSNQVWLVTIRFKKRGLMPNEFTVRLASTEFAEMNSIKELIDVGYKKLKENSLTGRSFFLTIPQRLVGYGRYIGYDSDSVLAVYTEKDKGRIALTDVAKHVLVNNEVVVVEYYDKKLFFATSSLVLAGLIYAGVKIRKYIRYRIHRNAVMAGSN